jgi:hypothetical protein
MGPPYDYEGAAAQLPPNQRQMMSAPSQAHLPPGGNNGQHHQQQQQLPQMGVTNHYGSYPGQQQHHRPSMTMQAGQQGGNPGFMHPAAPNQAHRNSLPPPMNMGHQYLNQGGYNPNFNPNQQGMPQQQQQHPQYSHPPQQHGYPPQQHMQQHPIPQQQQHQMQRQNTGGYSHPSQQQHQQQHQQQQQQHQHQHQHQQPYGQQPIYGHQSSNAGSNHTESQVSTVTGAPLNFNTSPTIDGNTMTGGVGGPNVGGLGGDYGQQFLPSGLNGDWQSDNDMHHRREMIQHM